MTTTSQTDLNTNTNAFGSSSGEAVSGNGGGGGGGLSENANSRAMSAGQLPNAGGQNFNITSNGGHYINNLNQSSNGDSSNQRFAADIGRRKKLKSRNATVPSGGGYSKDHLDAWLETCLKDASNAQLSSSSEFLDYNPTSAITKSNKNSLTQQQETCPPAQQHLQQQQQQQQPMYATSNLHSSGLPHAPHLHQHQQQFAMRTNSQTPMPTIPSGYSALFSQGIQRNMPNFMKHPHSPYTHRSNMMFPSNGGYYHSQNEQSQDFASLPPLVNIMGGSLEHEHNSTEVLNGSGSNPNIARGFRFSDPCLLNPSDNDSKVSGQNTPDRRNHMPNEMENNKFFAALMEQINQLHETNSKICRNLHENKVEIEALKHPPTWGMRHRRDSLSGLSTHSQPMVFGGAHSPAPTYHSGAYTPGMMTDVVREVKEAARVREDALLNRVKSLVEERQWSLSEGNLRMMRDIEDLKSQIHHLRSDRKEVNKRLNHLEAENKYMRQMLASIYNNNRNADIIYENEALRARKHLPHSRRSHSLNLHYGTIHHQPLNTSQAVEEQEEPLHINETADAPSGVSGQRPADLRSSFSSTEGSGGSGGTGGGESSVKTTPVLNGRGQAQILSPPKFALVSTPPEEQKRKRDKSSRKTTGPDDTSSPKNASPKQSSSEDLQRELNKAVTARKDADERIIALEKLVEKLQVKPSTHSSDALLSNGDGVNNQGGSFPNTGASLAHPTSQPHKWHHHYITPPAAVTSYALHHKQHQAQTTTSTSVNVAHSPPKLSVAGPITDL